MSNLSELLQEVADWAIPTFPNATPDSWCAHIQKEAQELRDDPSDIIEAADLLILVGGLVVKQGFTIRDLENAVRQKLEINKKRVWGEPDADGVVEHVEVKP